MRTTDKYVFFWKEHPFCNFTKCKIKFANPYYVADGDNPFYFSSSEQMFMWFKAMFFFDTETAEKILKTSDPEEARRLGREVKGYDDKKWNDVRVHYMKTAVSAKFIQNKELRDKLIDPKYDGKQFVEASPYDRIWGIGCDQDSALKLDNYKNWGRNELGKILNEVREKCINLKEVLDDLELVPMTNIGEV